MERRGSLRLGLNDETSMFTKDGYFSAVLENISVGGLFLRTNKSIEVGDMVEITIPIPNIPDMKNITVNVVAARIMSNGVAFKFDELDDKAQSALLYLTSSAQS